MFDGLFGGYSFYNNLVCTRMFSLSRSSLWTSETLDEFPKKMVIAASYDFTKPFFMDVSTGCLLLRCTLWGLVSPLCNDFILNTNLRCELVH